MYVNIFGVLIMATSFSGGRSRSTWREPQTMGKQQVNLISCECESSAPFFVIYKASRKPTPSQKKQSIGQIILIVSQQVFGLT
jgi:hypothetical protein